MASFDATSSKGYAKYDDNHYGKGCVKVAKIIKHPDGFHDFREYVVDIQLYGEFEEVYTLPTNRKVVPTDTMKNTIYVLAQKNPMNNPVEFGIDVTEYFLNKFSHISKVAVDITEVVWSRVILDNNVPHSHGFVDKQTHQNKASVTNDRKKIEAKAGVAGLKMLKTRGSSFEDYIVDEYTTLKSARDRIMATVANLSWTFEPGLNLKSVNHNEIYQKVKKQAVEIFVSHDESKSVQHTIDIIAKNVLKSIKEIQSIELNLPNSHYLLANTFGDNDNEIFVPAPEPYGNLWAKLSRK